MVIASKIAKNHSSVIGESIPHLTNIRFIVVLTFVLNCTDVVKIWPYMFLDLLYAGYFFRNFSAIHESIVTCQKQVSAHLVVGSPE